MALDPRKLLRPPPGEGVSEAPLAGNRQERMQRLQIGLAGILGMVLVVGLADIVISRAERTEAGVVPEAAPTTEPNANPAPRDPLADAGVVPDLPAEAGNTAAPEQPQTGDVPPPPPADATQQ